MGLSITILSGNCLCHNPRVVKEATALAEAGFAVEVLGAWWDASLKARDQELLARAPFRFTAVIDLAERGLMKQVQRALYRLRSKTGHLMFRFGDLANSWQFGYAVSALDRAARKRKADLFIAHSEVALIAVQRLLDSGCRVGVDMEDWFSQDLLPESRAHRPVQFLSRLERRALSQCVHATCPSQAMSEELARAYGCAPPTVIYNAFRWSDRKCLDGLLRDRRDRRVPSIHWYSQTVGPGRGLEDLLGALPRLRCEAELHLRGNPVAGFERWLSALVPDDCRARIFVHGLVSNDELLSRIAEHDIGFAGEMKYCRSRDLTVTNKIMEYLLAGLAVVASDTAGQREVAERAPDAVVLYRSGDAAALASSLDALLESPERLGRAKAAGLHAAERTFSWEHQEAVLLKTISRALSVDTQ